MPTPELGDRLLQLGRYAIEAKRLVFDGDIPSNELVDYARTVSATLRSNAPRYLRPDAQQLLCATASDCLAILELAVNWECEKLYGVEGMGPFNEF
jgi:hypothetical protein